MLSRSAFCAVLLALSAGTRTLAQPSVDARAWYLFDASSGSVLAQSNSSEQLDPASLTKLMTAYLAFDALADGRAKLADRVPVSQNAWRATGSRMFIEVNSAVAFDDLLRGLIVQSGNDAAIALAEYLAGSEAAFVDAMNHQAAALGMSQTHYRNPNGLPARDHVSTARDTALLAQALIEDFPQFYARYSEREFTYNEITQHNRNALLWLDESVDGLKTGYTRAAGYCLVSSAERDGMRLIAVVFGSSTADARTEGSLALLNYGFDSFETRKLYGKGQAVAHARVFKGSEDQLDLGLADDVFVTLPRGRFADLAISAALTVRTVAPVARDQLLGELEIRLGDQILDILPLVALDAVDEGWMLTRLADSISLWFE